MPKLSIDKIEVEVPDGTTIVEAAAQAGITVPTICHLAGHPHSTSCMVCVVKINGRDHLHPGCATIAADGMQVEVDCDAVRETRRSAIELLLSDHVGDCIAPCQVACPAHMDIPRMIRAIAADRMDDAFATVIDRIALPSVLGRICPAPCERACRRAGLDGAVSICMLKRFAGDTGSPDPAPHLAQTEAISGKEGNASALPLHVAIVGGGPTGLAAAWELLRRRHDVTLFEAADRLGGKLREIAPDQLPQDVLDADIARIVAAGLRFIPQNRVDLGKQLPDLQRDFDAVLIATGEPIADLKVNRNSFQTTTPGTFAAGGAVKQQRMAIRSLAEGHQAAHCIDMFLNGREPLKHNLGFSVHLGKLSDDELQRFHSAAEPAERVEPSREPGFSKDEARKEASRCLHCDCRKKDDCRLRDLSAEFDARPSRYAGERREFNRDMRHASVVYESGKCINCGLCVQIAEQSREPLGLTFIGRGFAVRTGIPFAESLAEGLQLAAERCVNACPTGALAFRDDVTRGL